MYISHRSEYCQMMFRVTVDRSKFNSLAVLKTNWTVSGQLSFARLMFNYLYNLLYFRASQSKKG